MVGQQYLFPSTSSVRSVLRQVSPYMGITAPALQAVQQMGHRVAAWIVHDALKLRIGSAPTFKRSARRAPVAVQNKTLSASFLQQATRLALPEELSKQAISQGTKAFTRRSTSALQVGSARADSFLRVRWRRIGNGAPFFLAAVVESVVGEILELAANAARDNKRARITPRDLFLAVKEDPDLSKLYEDYNICGGGVYPWINTRLLRKKSRKKRK